MRNVLIVIFGVLAFVLVATVWSMFDQAGVQHFLDNAWAITGHVVRIAGTLGAVGVGFALILGWRPFRSKEKKKH
jgi:mannose/fructose/N-acetylgalactosamine-specific phosphotransferase system component IIC